MYWADSIGARHIHAKLSEWEMKYGQFFKPCTYLAERAAGGVPLVRKMTGDSVVCFFLQIFQSNFFVTFVRVDVS
jgi:hypothetical protein